jgi:hypothetical protein
MTLRDAMKQYLGWCPRFSENSMPQLSPPIRFHIPARVQIILTMIIVVSLIGVLLLTLKPTHDVYISDIKITKDNVMIYKESFDKPLNETNVEDPDMVKIVSGENSPSGNCLAMDWSRSSERRGMYTVTLTGVTDFDEFNVSWIEKQSNEARPLINIWIMNGSASLNTQIGRYYQYTQPELLLDLTYYNVTPPRYPFSDYYLITALLKEWDRFSIVFNRRENLVEVYVNGVNVCNATIRSGFLGKPLMVRWTPR